MPPYRKPSFGCISTISTTNHLAPWGEALVVFMVYSYLMKVVSERRQTIVLGVLVVLLVVVGVLVMTNHKSASVTHNPVVSSPAVTPSPGTPGNPGDAAKSVQVTATPTPTAAVAKTTPGIAIGQFSIDQPQPGSIHVVSQITGTSSGSCRLVVTSPTHSTISTDGTIVFDGHYNICSFGKINVSENGTWQANLSVSSGTQTASSTTNFKVGS